MGFLRLYRRLIAIPVAAVMMFAVLPYGAAQAAMVSTEQAVSASAVSKRTGAEARAHVLGILQRADVQAEMRALGVNPVEAIDRVNAMSDNEIKHVAGRIDESPAGGSVVGIVVGSLLAVFLILLLTDILCLTSVFPFTKCVSKN